MPVKYDIKSLSLGVEKCEGVLHWNSIQFAQCL